MRIVVVLALLSLGQAASTAEDVYETILKDKLIGTETVTRTAGEKDGRLVSRVELTVGGAARSTGSPAPSIPWGAGTSRVVRGGE